jgi:hypothetical protein
VGAGVSVEEKMAAAAGAEPRAKETVVEIYGGEAEVAKAKQMIQEVVHPSSP